MSKKPIKKYLILGVLFFLPVVFLLMLYPSTNNYNILEVVKEDVLDISNLSSVTNSDIILKDHITVLGFLGSDPESRILEASNLKELVYNKFKGFKKFQIVMLVINLLFMVNKLQNILMVVQHYTSTLMIT